LFVVRCSSLVFIISYLLFAFPNACGVKTLDSCASAFFKSSAQRKEHGKSSVIPARLWRKSIAGSQTDASPFARGRYAGLIVVAFNLLISFFRGHEVQRGIQCGVAASVLANSYSFIFLFFILLFRCSIVLLFE